MAEAELAGRASTRKAVIGGTVDRLQRAEASAKQQVSFLAAGFRWKSTLVATLHGFPLAASIQSRAGYYLVCLSVTPTGGQRSPSSDVLFNNYARQAVSSTNCVVDAQRVLLRSALENLKSVGCVTRSNV